jgi:Recombinase zinc beta ribbon domain
VSTRPKPNACACRRRHFGSCPTRCGPAARARFDERRRIHTTAGTARRRRDVESPYLLSGLGRCGVCGGSFAVHTRQHDGVRVPFYGCAGFWKKGATVCTNNLMARRDGLDEEVLATLQDGMLRPTVVEKAIRLALAELAPTRQDDCPCRLERELATERAECERLADAIARGGPIRRAARTPPGASGATRRARGTPWRPSGVSRRS